MSATDGFGATFRFYIDGKVASVSRVGEIEVWDDRRRELDLIAAEHAWLADECEEVGRKWMVEVEFSDGEYVRWGTDVDGMVVPVEVGLGELMEAIVRRWTDE